MMITSQKIKSFSVSFDHKDFDESAHQKTISNFLNTDHITTAKERLVELQVNQVSCA